MVSNEIHNTIAICTLSTTLYKHILCWAYRPRTLPQSTFPADIIKQPDS